MWRACVRSNQPSPRRSPGPRAGPAPEHGAIAAVLYDLGYPAEAAKLIFIVGRTAGLAAHVMEEYARERPMRVRIPVVYDGPAAVDHAVGDEQR